jgi:DNA-binding transcriptional MerR regulator
MPSTTTDEPLLTIGQVAQRAALNTSHIRFYERVGVLPEPERVAGQRRYRDDVLHRLSIIDVAQRAGLTLEEIAPLTGPGNRSVDASRHIRELAHDKLPHIDALIARAQAVSTGSRSRSPATARAWTSATCSSIPR